MAVTSRSSSAAEKLVVMMNILDMYIDCRGDSQVLIAGFADGFADLLGQLR